MTRKEILMQMFLTQFSILTSVIDELQRNIRYRKITTTDCLELIIAIERLEMLKEIQKWVFSTMQIDEDSEFKNLYRKFDAEQRKKEMF